MRSLRLLTAGSALLVLTACGGSSTPTAADPLISESPSPAAPAATESPAGIGVPTVSPAPKPTAAASPTSAATKASPTPARTTAASPKATPKPTPQPSPRPSPSPTTKPSPAPPPGPTHPLEMTTGYRFSPMDLTIGVGDAVRAHNGDTIDHTFTGATWDSGNVAPGGYAKVFRFNKAGTFSFVCTPHQDLGMKGTLTVR